MPFDAALAIERIPRWMIGLGILGTAAALWYWGLRGGGGFLIGAGAAYLNFRVLESIVNRMAPGDSPKGAGTGLWMTIQFVLFVLGAFVIIEASGFDLRAALYGFFVCPAAAMLEILYELLTYGHS